MARVTSISGQRVMPLDEGWLMSRHEPDEVLDPAALSTRSEPALGAGVPGTAAKVLLSHGAALGDLDASDFWYVTRFSAPSEKAALRFNGLATLADVWLNGQPLFSSDSMFVAHERELGAPKAENELAIRFRSLKNDLKKRRARPRFKTRLVADQALRHVRTTLFGRMPGVAPLVAPVGPWRSIELIEHGRVIVERADVRAELVGTVGRVSARLSILHRLEEPIRAARLCVGEASTPLELREQPEVNGLGARRLELCAELALERVAPWWPHTHGEQPLYPVSIELDFGSEKIEVKLGRTGFRKVELVSHDGEFELCLNDQSVFCRGACSMPLDTHALDADPSEIERTLRSVRAAGMNMLRVQATGIYESDRFFELCDALGIMVWQDFMFARLDYPLDEAFQKNVELEARQLLDRTALCPSLVVLCGNSEVEQQVGMLGLDPELGRSSLFTRLLPELCAELRPDCAYVSSTPSGGALPFHADSGTSHYFGVGAYRRPFSDARLANVRFAAECLAFSNVPDSDSVELLLDGDGPCSLAWKAGVPRDRGASWDYEDVRDHYLEQLFGLDARELRATDPERWLELGRVATGEMMARTFGEWRRQGSSCRGALVWHLRDLVPGAGCGLLDRAGRPKAPYFFLARALQPVQLIFTDEGLNGLSIHALNECARSISVELALRLYRAGSVRIAAAERRLELEPRSKQTFGVDALVGSFIDSSYAYRFGPPPFDVAVATLTDQATGRLLSEACFFPLGPPRERRADLDLVGQARRHPEGFMLELRASAFAYAVHVEAPGFMPEDDYFPLEPDRPRAILLRAEHPGEQPLSVRITSLNADSCLVVRCAEQAHPSDQCRPASARPAAEKVFKSA